MAVPDRVRELVAPVVAAEAVDLYDVEHNGGVVRVLVDAEGGVDLETIARLTRAVSRLLDEHDPVPGRYTLEVSSPGLERPLRTPDHFRRAVGTDVKVKTKPEADGPRRIQGLLAAADDRRIEVRDGDGVTHVVAADDISSARTVFEWGPTPKPGGSKRRAKAKPRPENSEREATSP